MQRLFATLLAAYGPQQWWPATSIEEMMVGAILVQNTSWRQVPPVIARLQAQGLLSPAALRRVDDETLWTLLRPVGYFRVKSRRLKALADCMGRYDDRPERLFQLEILPLRNTLLQVHGIGKETADAIVCYGARRPLFVVDAYAKRLLHRLGWLSTEAVSYDVVQALVQQHMPVDADILGELHALIVQHAKHHCRSRPHCSLCPLPFCPTHGRSFP
ncbi:MAG: hypothetical protein H7837_13450 [Magnetococcus sp. MYC-9]